MKNFALIGAAGYIAPRHLKAIKETGNKLLCALDPHDSVGMLDAYYPDAAFFTEFERFDRFVYRNMQLKNNHPDHHIDYVSICSPNYLHDAHIRWTLRSGANAICEKPLGLNPQNVKALAKLQKESGKEVNTILQLRLHPEVIALKRQLKALHQDQGQKQNVQLTYITPRGTWYKYSWKGDISKSGGIATNIGIHLFDMLIWLFGKVETSYLHLKKEDKMSGFLELENANVSWYLSTDKKDLTKKLSPSQNTESGSTVIPLSSYRSLDIDNKSFDFTSGFTNLHTASYQNIINGHGFTITDALPAIDLVHKIRHSAVQKTKGENHKLLA